MDTDYKESSIGGKMREVEKQCARNCIRKFDKAYKLFDSIEQRIFEDYMKDANIDPEDIMKVLQEDMENNTAKDYEMGEKLIQKGII